MTLFLEELLLVVGSRLFVDEVVLPGFGGWYPPYWPGGAAAAPRTVMLKARMANAVCRTS